MTPVRFAILGAGIIAKRFAQAAALSAQVEVVTVASKDSEKAKAFAAENSIPSWGSYCEALSRSDVDAVYIATTHNFHHDLILDALNHGKHVLCEKAMVLTRKEAEDCFNLGREKGLLVMEAMWARFNPCVRQAAKWVQEGAIGQLVTGSLSWGFEASHDPKHRLVNPDLAGGAAWDIGVYALEVSQFVVGEKPVNIRTLAKSGPTGVDMIDHYALEYPNAIVSLTCNLMCNMPFTVGFYGTEGYISCNNLPFTDRIELHKADGTLVQVYNDPDALGHGTAQNGFIYQMEEAARCIREGLAESPVIPHEDTLWACSVYDRLFGENPRPAK